MNRTVLRAKDKEPSDDLGSGENAGPLLLTLGFSLRAGAESHSTHFVDAKELIFLPSPRSCSRSMGVYYTEFARGQVSHFVALVVKGGGRNRGHFYRGCWRRGAGGCNRDSPVPVGAGSTRKHRVDSFGKLNTAPLVYATSVNLEIV